MKRAAVIALGALLLACGDAAEAPVAEPLRCVPVDPDCEPGYEPSYDAIFARVLQPTCGKDGVSCHSSRGRQGGLSFEDADVAHRELLASSVRPGDASCSELMVRLESSDARERMPPPAPIAPEHRCAIVRWIQAGAARR